MSTFWVLLLILVMGQDTGAPAADPEVKGIAPLLGSDVFSVVRVDFERLNAPDLATRVFGNHQSGMMADARTATVRLTEETWRSPPCRLSRISSNPTRNVDG